MIGKLMRVAVVASVLGGIALTTTPGQPGVAAAEENPDKCFGSFELIADPTCLKISPNASIGEAMQEMHIINELNRSPETCIVTATHLGVPPGDAFGACAARMAALEEQAMELLADPDFEIRTPEGMTNEQGCMAAAAAMGLPAADASKACADRMTRIKEREEAGTGQATAGSGQQPAGGEPPAATQPGNAQPPSVGTDNRQVCEQIAQRVIEMSDTMYTPRWEQLGGDAEFNWLGSQFVELDCQRVLNLN